MSGHPLTDLLAVLEHRGHVCLQRQDRGTLCFRPSASFRAPPEPRQPPPQQQPPTTPKSSGQAAGPALDAAATEERRAQHRQGAQDWEEAMPRGGMLEAQLLQAVEAGVRQAQPCPGDKVAKAFVRICGR